MPSSRAKRSSRASAWTGACASRPLRRSWTGSCLASHTAAMVFRRVSSLETSFLVVNSGRRKIRVHHPVGETWTLLGDDRYSFARLRTKWAVSWASRPALRRVNSWQRFLSGTRTGVFSTRYYRFLGCMLDVLGKGTRCHETCLNIERERKRCSSLPYAVPLFVGARAGLSVMAPLRWVALWKLSRQGVVAGRYLRMRWRMRVSGHNPWQM